ncbi:hypothetical protein BS78_08G125500 [Paspalum vaginatum]|nr:hypothetical protein BS78_08G125500 [Paspalum vaginatum]KAJ1266101.1 hypothetical protein BS78_08G125500 [Paspalum vaginatum]
MDKSRTVCKACVAHHYWHHMDDRKRFFKILVGDFKNRLIIPKKFAANFRGQISGGVKLEAPDGKTYAVQVTKEQNELVLRSGWADFASAYELEYGEFLVFRNSENSHFKVRIFDKSCCEKVLSCVPIDGVPCVQKRQVPHGNHTQSPIGKRMEIGSPSGSRKTAKTRPTDSPSKGKDEHVPSSEGIQEPTRSNGFQKPTKSWFFLPTRFNMTSEHTAKLIALEQKIQPKIPFYVTAMSRKCVAYGTMIFSKNYAMKHLANENGTIQLSQLHGSKTWAVNLEITQTLNALSTGWMDFVHDNKLKEGDICVFQPSKSKNGLALIFHPLEESRHPQPSGYVPSDKSPRHGVPNPPYMFPRRTALNDDQKSKVEEKVGAIQSDIPIYVTVMKISNVDRMSILEFSSAYAAKYLRHKDQTLMLRRPGHIKDHTWEAELPVNKTRRQRRYLGRGWRQFVGDNKLKVGDICLFHLVKNTKKLTMNVHIIRKRSV